MKHFKETPLACFSFFINGNFFQSKIWNFTSTKQHTANFKNSKTLKKCESLSFYSFKYCIGRITINKGIQIKNFKEK